jgi:aldose 1-epimerase
MRQSGGMSQPIEREPYGTLPDGTPVERFTLRAGGLVARILTYGGIVASLDAPDREGRLANVVLGCADLAGYLADTWNLGALIGRYANRIAGGRFTLDGAEYRLEQNRPPNTLHGGSRGFAKMVWRAEPASDAARLVLRHVSPDGDQGFPGRLEVSVAYEMTPDGTMRIEYEATTDKPTVLNLTNHSYFNLAGEGEGDVYGHELELAADAFTLVDASLVPTGEIRPVAGTPLDFRAPAPIGARIRQADEQILFGRGYDHNFVLRGTPGELRPAARVRDPASGRILEVSTTEPGVQFYSGNFLDGSRAGTRSRTYRQSGGLCLETQHFPDSVNRPSFPGTVLRPGETFRSTTVWRFLA